MSENPTNLTKPNQNLIYFFHYSDVDSDTTINLSNNPCDDYIQRNEFKTSYFQPNQNSNTLTVTINPGQYDSFIPGKYYYAIYQLE